MGQTLTNGIYLPDEGEVRCYDGLASNWTTLDSVVGGYRAHVANENIHITSEERSKWDTGVTQAYVLRYASVSLTALGTVAFSALDNTDNVKIGDKVLDSEGKLFALTAVDTENNAATLSALLIDLSKDSDLSNYYTKPETDTLLNDKANDTDVLHKSGDETAAGIKTFSDATYFKSLNFSYNVPDPSSSSYSQFFITNTITYTSGDPSVTARVNFRVLANGTISIFPHENNLYSLGLQSRRFKGVYTYLVNDTNPGALSLPNLSAGVDISGYITLGTYQQDTYTPPSNGYITIMIYGTSENGLFVYSGSFGTGMRSIGGHPTYGQVSVICLPVRAGTTYTIENTGATNIAWAKFYPCQGNI